MPDLRKLDMLAFALLNSPVLRIDDSKSFTLQCDAYGVRAEKNVLSQY